MTEEMTDGGQEKIHEVLHLIFINQWLGPRELAKKYISLSDEGD